MVNVETSRQSTPEMGRSKRLGERNLIKGFAALGVACLVFQTYLYARWLFSASYSRVDGGPDPVPTHMTVVAWVLQIAIPILFVWALYALVIKPYRREHRVPIEGIFLLAMPFMYWNDCVTSFFKPAYSWNTTLFNMGSWYGFIPGWQSPTGGRVAEPLLVGPWIYAVGGLLPAIAMAKMMNAAKARRPQLSAVKLWGFGFALMAAWEVVLEPALAVSGVFAFAGTIPELTLFQGRYFQFPIYEIVLFAAFCPGAYVAFLYFRNDKGETIAERGLSRLRTTPHRRALIRFVAVVGAVNAGILAYNVAYGLTTLAPTYRWADEIAFERSYLRDEQCGGTTGVACPGFELDRPAIRERLPSESPIGATNSEGN